MRILILALLIAGLAPHAKAQDSLQSEPLDFLLKVDLANLINPTDPSLLVSGEYFLTSRLSFNQEIGWVVLLHWPNDDADMVGWKLREELRVYPRLMNQISSLNAYISLNFSYRKLSIKDNYMIVYDCGEGCSYFKDLGNGKSVANRYVIMARIGMLEKGWGNWYFELDYGLGIQYNNQSLKKHTGEGELRVKNNLKEIEYNEIIPYGSVSFKLVYAF